MFVFSVCCLVSRQCHSISPIVRIPTKVATESEGKRPAVPIQCGR
jgi:hypothetical protein